MDLHIERFYSFNNVLARLLKENQMKDKENDIFESAVYVDELGPGFRYYSAYSLK